MNVLRRVSRLGVQWVKPLSRSEASVILQKNLRCFATKVVLADSILDPREDAKSPVTVSSPTGSDKTYPPKIVKLVDEIGKLTLLEVSELNELLKKTLNIPDTPMMGAMPMMGAVAAAPSEDDVDVAPVAVQTSFTLKLLKYDESKKVALIKEIKALLEGMNLVQAKKFVESAPTIVKADVAKEEAEKLKAALEAVGASCEIA